MRIDTFDLRAFGPFTAKTLDLSKGAHGLHVVFGQNEAGKSSALRALGAALFGIHSRTTDKFLHDYSALRLAMALRNAKGEEISFVRRKAQSKSLWDAEESAALPDDALRPFLGGIQAEEFERVFALDHVRLRDGSDGLLAAAEGADAAIVGAALGLNDLRAVREAIEMDASELFAPRGTKRTINAGIAEWKRYQKDLRERSLSAHAWTEARRGLERCERQRDEAVAREKELRRRHGELEFVKRNRARVARLAAPRAKLEELAGVPDLQSDFAARRLEADSALREAVVLLGQSQQEEERRKRELELLRRDFTLIDREEEIRELRDLSVESAKGVRDRDRLRAKADSASTECDRLAAELGLAVPVTVATLEGLRLALGSEERCEELVREHTRITTARKGVERSLGNLGRDRAACAERLAAPEESVDAAPLASAVTAALKLGSPDEELAALRAGLEELDRTLTQGLERLSGFSGDVEKLEASPVPGPESLAKFGQRFREIDEEERDARRKREELQARSSQTDAEIDRLSLQEAVPSEDDLTNLRTRRDKQWRLVRKAWLDGANVDAEARELDADRPLVESFGRSIEQGDEVGDRMRRASERVVQQAELHRQREQLERELAEREDAVRNLEERRETLERAWRDAWKGSGLEVRDPASMKDMLAERLQLIELAEGRRRQSRKVADVVERMAAAHSDLAAAMAATGAPVSSGTREPALAPMLQLAEERRDVLTKALEARRLDEQNLARIDREVGEEQSKQDELKTERNDWRTAFDAATRGLPRREGDPPDDITRVLRHVRTLVTHWDEVGYLRDRIEKIDGDAASLERQLQAFRAAHAADLPAEAPAATIARLVALLEETKRDRQAYDIAAKQLEEAEEQRKNAEAAVAVANQKLGDLADEAGAASIGELPELERRAEEKRRFRDELERIRNDLLDEGCGIEETENRVAAQAGVEIEAELNPLEAELERVSEDADSKREAAAQARLEVEAMNGETGAAEMAEKAAGVAARLRDDVERYARLVLSSRLLSSAVERFRERNEAPMLRYASRHIAGITHGRYRRVETDIDGKGQPHFLVREASDGPAKLLDALSDGTRDQLYLALVLGSLEHRIESGAEPMPLVLDDVLVHFDDERSMASLEALAEFSRTTQVLLFTHHARIREQAESLGAGGQTFVLDL